MSKSRALTFIIRELNEMIPPTMFFVVGFNLIVLTTQLVLDDYRLQFLNFMVATTAALVVGKSVLIANALPFLRRFDRAPLVQPILFKTIVYFLIVFAVAIFGEAYRIPSRRRDLGRCSRVCARTFHLASLRCNPGVDLRTFPDLYHGYRGELAARRWRTR